MSEFPAPSIGRIVLYRGKDGLVRPAIVTQVHGQFCVNLNVFGHTSADNETGIHTSVTHAQPDQEPGCFPSWHWMPSQRQAAPTRTADVPAQREESPVPQSGPRITKEQIERLLAASSWSDQKLGAKTTVVCLTLPSGFEVIASSGCVNAANYDHAAGVAIGRRRCIDMVWMLEGYRLACFLQSDFASA